MNRDTEHDMAIVRLLPSALLVCALIGACADNQTTPTPAMDGADTGQTAPDVSGEPDTSEPDTSEPDSDSGQEDESFSDDPLEWPLDAEGPFRVGFRSQEVVWTTPESAAQRTVLMNIWYPTLDEEGEPAVYLGLGAFRDEEVYTDATPAESVYGPGFPVHAHSHGFQGFGGTSSDMMRHFASHGWIAVAPDHTNNTLSDHRDPLPTAHYIHRPLDITAVLDTLETLAEDDPLAGKADTSRVLLSGHSFGSYTTWASQGASFDMEVIRARCEDGGFPEGSCTEAEIDAFGSDLSDERVVATIPMAGTLRTSFFGDEGHLTTRGPVLFMSGSEDQVGASDQFSLIDGIDFTWIELEGGCHQSFALGFCNTLDPQEGFTIINTYALAFARREILADEGEETLAILSGSQSVSEKVTFQKK